MNAERTGLTGADKNHYLSSIYVEKSRSFYEILALTCNNGSHIYVCSIRGPLNYHCTRDPLPYQFNEGVMTHFSSLRITNDPHAPRHATPPLLVIATTSSKQQQHGTCLVDRSSTVAVISSSYVHHTCIIHAVSKVQKLIVSVEFKNVIDG